MSVAAQLSVDRFERTVERSPMASTVVGGLCTSASSVFVALAAVSTGTVAFFRFLIAVPALAPLALAEARDGSLRSSFNAKALVAGALLAGDALLWNQAITESGAGIATVIVNAQVIVVPVLAWITLGEEPSLMFAATVPAMLAGVALAGGLAGGATGADPTHGALLACGAAACYAGFLFLLREASEPGRAVGTVLAMTIAGAAVSAVVAPLWHGLDLAPSASALGWIAAVALSSQVIAYVLIGPALPRLSAGAGAAVLLIQPVGSVVLGAIALGERPSALQLGGCALVLGAVYAATLAERRKHEAGDAVDHP
jgi:drug/metabolite transporter (DMT)-like permease